MADLLVVLFVVAGIGVAIFGLFSLGMMGWIGSKKEDATKRAPELLDELFDGRQHATYRVTAVGLTFEQVVVGGIERGYSLMHDSDDGGVKVLIFNLTDPAKVPTAPTSVPEPVRSSQDAPEGESTDIVIIVGGALIAMGVIVAAYAPQIAAAGIIAVLVGLGLAVYGAWLKWSRKEAAPRRS